MRGILVASISHLYGKRRKTQEELEARAIGRTIMDQAKL